jgi:Kef-type K+ transport system membrane component KefB
MEESIFYQLSLVMALATGLSLLARLFRQPLIIAYIITGILVGPSLLHVIHSPAAFESFSQIGIALLLFIIGLGLNVQVVRATGKPVFITFLAVIAGVGGVGLLLTHLLRITGNESIILATAILFSSTIIVIKALSDKKETTRLYAQITIGITLVEDLAATIVLLFVSASSAGGSTFSDFGNLLIKGVALGAGLLFAGGIVLPKLSKIFARNQELLYIFALAWAFSIASIFKVAGFSLEVGALFAGVALAHLPYAPAISTKLKPLRDFFIVLFFIHLGEGFKLGQINDALFPAIILSLAVLVVKPFVIAASLGALGYTKQTGFKAAIHLSQISEFSVILVILAGSIGLVGDNIAAIATLTALITIAISTYIMKYDDELYRRFANFLSIFERSTTKRELANLSNYPLVLLGYHEGGYSFVKTFREMKKRYVVVDYDPEIIDHLEQNHIHNLYGDVTDVELLEEIGVRHAEIVISTIRDSETNHMLSQYLSRSNDEAIFICYAENLDEAEALYEAGAAYVLLPHFIGNEHINQFLKRNGNDKRAFTRYRKKHLVTLGNLAVKD